MPPKFGFQILSEYIRPRSKINSKQPLQVSDNQPKVKPQKTAIDGRKSVSGSIYLNTKFSLDEYNALSKFRKDHSNFQTVQEAIRFEIIRMLKRHDYL